MNRFCRDFKKKSFAEFQEEGFQFIDDSGFEIALGVVCFLIEPKEFEDIGIFEHVLRISDDLSFVRERFYPAFIPAECKSFKRSRS